MVLCNPKAAGSPKWQAMPPLSEAEKCSAVRSNCRARHQVLAAALRAVGYSTLTHCACACGVAAGWLLALAPAAPQAPFWLHGPRNRHTRRKDVECGVFVGEQSRAQKSCKRKRLNDGEQRNSRPGQRELRCGPHIGHSVHGKTFVESCLQMRVSQTWRGLFRALRPSSD